MTTTGKRFYTTAYQTKPGTPLGGRLCQADQETKYSASDIDGLLDMISGMDEKKRDEIIMHCDENTRNRLLRRFYAREFDQCNIKQMKSLHEEGRTPEKKRPTTMKGNATDAVFSSEAANNYYQAIGYRVGPSSVLTHDNDDVSSKNISWKGEDAVMSAGTRTTKSTEILTSFQEVMADAMKKGKTPNEVAEHLMNRENKKMMVNSRRTEKLLAEALDKNMTPTEIANFLLKAEQAKRKKEKEAQQSNKELLSNAVRESNVSLYGEDNSSFKQRKISEQLVKDALKHGGKTPAEIAAFILRADEERKVQELVYQALKVCKTPQEIAEYLMKAEEQKLMEEKKKGQGNALPDTNHLKSVSSMASVLSSECSIRTEIVANGNKQKGEIPKKTRVASVCSNDVDLSSNATSKEKKKKPLTSIIHRKKQSSSKIEKPLKKEVKPTTSDEVFVDKKDNESQFFDGNDYDKESTDPVRLYEMLTIPRKVKSGKSIAVENQDESTKASTSSVATISSSKDETRSSKGSSLLWDGIGDEENLCSNAKDVKVLTTQKSISESENVENDKEYKERSSKSTGKEEKNEGRPNKMVSLMKQLRQKVVLGNKTTKSQPKKVVDLKTMKAPPEDQTSEEKHKTFGEWFEGPVSSIRFSGSDVMSEGAVSLPSALRQTSKIKIWDEPSILKRWWSKSSHQSTLQTDDESSHFIRSKDSMAYVDDDQVEQGCCSGFGLNGYVDEIALFAVEVHHGLKSVASDIMGFYQSNDLQQPESDLSEKTNQLIDMMRMKVTGEEKDQKEAVAIAMETEISKSHESETIKNRANEIKSKRNLYLSKLKKVSLTHI